MELRKVKKRQYQEISPSRKENLDKKYKVLNFTIVNKKKILILSKETSFKNQNLAGKSKEFSCSSFNLKLFQLDDKKIKEEEKKEVSISIFFNFKIKKQKDSAQYGRKVR